MRPSRNICIVALTLLVAACNHNGGIDYGEGTAVPRCDSDRKTSNVVQLAPRSIVRKTSEDASMRVWHYQNSTKEICMLTGQARVIAPTSSVN